MSLMTLIFTYALSSSSEFLGTGSGVYLRFLFNLDLIRDLSSRL